MKHVKTLAQLSAELGARDRAIGRMADEILNCANEGRYFPAPAGLFILAEQSVSTALDDLDGGNFKKNIELARKKRILEPPYKVVKILPYKLQ